MRFTPPRRPSPRRTGPAAPRGRGAVRSPSRSRGPRAGGSAAGPRQDPTRERLLEAAARTLAERGFEGATVRAICRRARANVGAVNYHFGSKDALTVTAVRWAAARLPEDAWHAGGADLQPLAPPSDPSEGLRRAVRGLASRILGRHADWEVRLMMRVLSEPNPALDAVVREVIEPRLRALEGALGRFLPGAPPRTLRLTALSVVGQIAYHRFASPVALRLLGERSLTAELADEVAAHVAAFTERSLRAAAAEAHP